MTGEGPLHTPERVGREQFEQERSRDDRSERQDKDLRGCAVLLRSKARGMPSMPCPLAGTFVQWKWVLILLTLSRGRGF